MEDHLSSLDAAFWGLESQEAPLRLGALAVFGPGAEGWTPEGLAALLAERAAAVPRLRQAVQHGWNPLEGPRWREVPYFDARRHIEVRQVADSASPLNARMLESEAALAMGGGLVEGEPPWRLCLFTNGRLRDGFALLAEFHHAAVDGLRAMELGAALFDPLEGRWRGLGAAAREEAMADDAPAEDSRPEPGVFGYADPRRAMAGLRGLGGGLRALPGQLPGQARRTQRAAEIVASVASTAMSNALNPYDSPLHAPASGGRTLAFPTLPLDAVHRIRKAHGGTVNDVLLALLSSALRSWLLGAGYDPGVRPIRVLVPVSSRRRPGDPRHGNQLSGHLVQLPVAEPDPLRRLQAVREDMREHKERGPRRGPGAFALLTDMVPPAAHRVAAPLLRESAPLLFDALATNVPLPDVPFTLGGAPLRALHPLAPRARGHALAVAMTPYRGTVHFGLHGVAEGELPLEGLAEALRGALKELSEVT